jgi:type 1 fimbria pilin
VIHGQSTKGRGRDANDVGFVLLDHEAAQRIKGDGQVGAKDKYAGNKCATTQPYKAVLRRESVAYKNAKPGEAKTYGEPH